jgi:hypothetical protein
MVACIAWAERDRQQSTLAATRDTRPDVEERSRDPAAGEIPDPAGLLDDIEALRLAGRGGHVRRGDEP